VYSSRRGSDEEGVFLFEIVFGGFAEKTSGDRAIGGADTSAKKPTLLPQALLGIGLYGDRIAEVRYGCWEPIPMGPYRKTL
jgi:hypothetical protein